MGATLVGEDCTWALGMRVAVFAAASQLNKVIRKIQTLLWQLQPSQLTHDPLLLKEQGADACGAATRWWEQ